MSVRECDVIFQDVENKDCLVVWTDATCEQIRSVPGVAKVSPWAEKHKFLVTFDPRYDRELVKDAIRELQV